MIQTKRWGKKYVDKRDWRVYNEQLVKRGEYYLDFDWVKNWHKEVEEINEGKVGRPFIFPESLIKLQAIWHATTRSYRTVEGITRDVCEAAQIPEYNDYSTINRRVNQLDTQLQPPQHENLTIFSDGSGLQVIEGGEYLREKYGKKNRKWIQVILLGDPETKEPVSYEVNIIQTSELPSAKKQVQQLQKQNIKIKAFGGDGTYDEINLWNELEQNHITPIIKPDKNARDDSESQTRNQAVKERNKKGYKKWAEKIGYDDRWPATEGIFSAFKRIFGEQIHATSEQGMLQEARIKVWAYQKLKRYGETA